MGVIYDGVVQGDFLKNWAFRELQRGVRGGHTMILADQWLDRNAYTEISE